MIPAGTIIRLMLIVFTGSPFVHEAAAQFNHFIIAGKTSEYDSLYVNPITLDFPWEGEDSADIDINRDNIMDYRILVYECNAMGMHYYYARLTTNHPNAYYCNMDLYPHWTCWVTRFSLGDTIEKKASWTDSLGYFAMHGESYPGWEPYDWGEWSDLEGYTGIMLQQNNDTIYGWIHMKVGDWRSSLQIDTIAFQTKKTEGTEKVNSDRISIYPVPSKETITVEYPSFSRPATLRVYSVQGEELIRQQITDHHTLIDVSDLPAGIYFVKLNSNNGTSVKKILKE